jgi:hypothetical protein
MANEAQLAIPKQGMQVRGPGVVLLREGDMHSPDVACTAQA